MEFSKEYFLENVPVRDENSHKGDMGTLLNISGSYSMAGAGILSSLAAHRSGVGLLKHILPESIYEIVATNIPESVYVPVKDSIDKTISKDSIDDILNACEKSTALLFGCGLKNTSDTRYVLKKILLSFDRPIIIDADGINALSTMPEVLSKTKAEIVLTPHIVELSRLIGKDKEEIIENKEIIADEFTKKYPNVTLVIKGHHTYVKKQGIEGYVNNTGNAGMARGGSGDVLSGIIGAFLSQGISPFDASVISVYVHGRAGDICKEKFGEIYMLPRDVVSELKTVYKELTN